MFSEFFPDHGRGGDALTTSLVTKSCLFYILIGRNKLNCPHAKLICQGCFSPEWQFKTVIILSYIIHESRLETVIRLSDIIFRWNFSPFLLHHIFRHPIFPYQERKKTGQGSWFFSIKKGGCGIRSRNNNEETERRLIPPSEDRCFGLIIATAGT